jgi:oligopeptide/dipeptide ABC transporter ATP-binding protein
MLERATPLVALNSVSKAFPAQRRTLFNRKPPAIHAVNDVSFSVGRGETLGLVGESGSGKSTIGRLAVRMLEPSAGSISFDGRDIGTLRGEALKKARRHFQFVFQDPFGSLNPRMTVNDIVGEPLEIFASPASPAERRAEVARLLELVGLRAAQGERFPHEFSGGQRQRIAIARAIALRPQFVVCDEPVSALDVSVQAQILNLLMELQRKLGLSYLFISHDLRVVRHISHRVAVLYLGSIVELGATGAVFDRPAHPYTRGLIAAAPHIGAPPPDTPPIAGEIPSVLDLPAGCRFHTRCPFATERCRRESPELREWTANRFAACHFAENIAALSEKEPQP